MTLASRKYFDNDIGNPGKLTELLKLIDESGPEVISEIKSELSSRSAHSFSVLSDRILKISNSKKLYNIFMDSIPEQHAFQSGNLVELFTTSFYFLQCETIDKLDFQRSLVKLIDGIGEERGLPSNNAFYVVSRAIHLMYGFTKGNLGFELLDDCLCRHAKRFQGEFFEHNFINAMPMIAVSMHLPKLLHACASWYKDIGKTSSAAGMIERLMMAGKVTSDHLQVFSEVFASDELDDIYERAVMFRPSLENLTPYIEFFGEERLFTPKALGKLADFFEQGTVPSLFKIIEQPAFDPAKFPFFVDYTIKVGPRIYELLDSFNEERRPALRNLFIEKGLGSDVFELEKGFWKKQLSQAVQDSVGDDAAKILDALKTNRVFEYEKALLAVKEIGVLKVAPSLTGLNRRVLKDFLKGSEMGMDEKRQFMKAFPQARSQILEDDLGL